MKKTIAIHIGGYVFNIDEDAYEILNKWLDSLSTQFVNDPDGKEILEDIELGAAEHLNRLINSETGAVTMDEVHEVIRIMGEATDFEESDAENETEAEPKSEGKAQKGEPVGYKRLYRDIDDKKIAGVASGLSYYLGVSVHWVRVFFILSTLFLAGSGFLIYVLLLIMMPEAKTTGEKLAMRGKSVTVSTIQSSIRAEFDHVKHRLGEFSESQDFYDLKDRAGRAGDSFLTILTRVLKVFSVILGVAFLFAGLIALTAISIAVFFDSLFPFPDDVAHLSDFWIFMPTTISSGLTKLGLFLVIAVPVVSIVLSGLRMIFRFKTNHKLIGISGTGVWIIGLVILILSGIGVGKHFESFNSVNKDYAVDLQKGKTIILKMNDKPDFFAFDEVRRFDDFYLVSDAGHNRVYGQPELKIVNSEDSAIMLSVEYKSRGRSKRDALRKSEAISYDWIATDSTISLNHYFSLPDNEKYFAQDVELTLAVPEGIRLFVETEAGEIIHYIKNKNNLWTNELLDKTWLMTSEGLDSIR